MSTRYTYRFLAPSTRLPFRVRIRWTRGQFVGWTKPTGLAHVPYAVFRRQASEILIPEYDLTAETRNALARLSPSKAKP